MQTLVLWVARASGWALSGCSYPGNRRWHLKQGTQHVPRIAERVRYTVSLPSYLVRRAFDGRDFAVGELVC